MLKKGKFYGIGVGPGDSELVTLKAARILNEVDVICSPRASKDKLSTALSIINPLIENRENDLEIIAPVFPMSEDHEGLDKYWTEASDLISSYLDENKDVAFITLGDPSIYSTFSYVEKKLKGKYDIEMIPGITSFTSCAANLGIPLVEKDEILVVVPKVDNRFKSFIDNGESIVLMKPSRNIESLEEFSAEFSKMEVYTIKNSSKPNQEIIKGFSKENPYFTTSIAKKKKK